MATKKKKDAFILQAGILAAAGILCRIIGILYRSPLTSIIGDEGNGYYSAAYNFYTIILLVSSYSIPSAISKVIAGKLALREYKNAYRVFQCALIYVLVIGGIASLFTFFCAGFLVKENSAVVLRVFAPTIFFSGLLGVLRGYFQAHGTMMQTSVSQILEQILNAAVSIGAAYGFVSLAERESDTTRAVYGAAGSALGTGAGVLIALLFMCGVYVLNRKMISRRIHKDTEHAEDSYKKIFGMIIGMVTPIILSTFIYNFSTSLNQTIYTNILSEIKGMAEAEIATMYGIFAGKAVVISNVPIALASAMSAAIIPAVSSSFALGDMKQVREKIAEAVHTTMLIAIPSAVGLTVLARPVTELLFPQKASLDQAAMLLSSISITVIFYSLSTITNGVLQAAGKVNLPVINAAGALVVQTGALVALLLYTDVGLYALSIAMVVYSFLMCVLNQIAARRTLRYKQELMKTFFKPLCATFLMGICAYFVYQGIYALLPVNIAALVPSILLAFIVYFVVLMALGGVEEADLRRLPKGYLLAKIGKKCYLLRDPEHTKTPPKSKGKSSGQKKKTAGASRSADGENKLERQRTAKGKTMETGTNTAKPERLSKTAAMPDQRTLESGRIPVKKRTSETGREPARKKRPRPEQAGAGEKRPRPDQAGAGEKRIRPEQTGAGEKRPKPAQTGAGEKRLRQGQAKTREKRPGQGQAGAGEKRSGQGAVKKKRKEP